METTAGGWTIIDREAGVLTREYNFTKDGTATTFVARMREGGLLVVSPSTDLSDEAAAELEEFGPVRAIVANNGFHHLGQGPWAERYPESRRFASPESAARIAKKSKIDLTYEPLSELTPMLSDDVQVREVPNTKLGETWVWAKVGDGYAWYVSDILANMQSLPPKLFPRLLFKFTDSAPGLKVFNLAMRFMVRDRKGTLRLMLQDMEGEEPTVIVPGHGAILSSETVAADARRVIEAAL